MTTQYFAKAKLGRFLWVQDFAARLVELGVPASTEALLALGRERLNSSPERDPVRDAETVWSQWETET
jgi:hypothetical protein